MADKEYEPIILRDELTADLYHSVTVSIAPGRRISAIVGPRGGTKEQVGESVAHLVAHIRA